MSDTVRSQANVDLWIAIAFVLAYFVLVIVVLPPSEYQRAFGAGALVFAAVPLAARLLGQRRAPGFSVFIVAAVSAFILVVPTFPAMGDSPLAAVPIGLLGMQTAALLWAALRWPPRPRSSKRVSLGRAWKTGAGAATGLSMIATIPIVIVMMRPGGPGAKVILVYAGYYVGLLAAATCYWLLQSIAHLATGRYLVGVLGGTCVYFAVWPVAAIVEKEPIFSWPMLAMAAVAGGLVGPAIALGTTAEEVA